MKTKDYVFSARLVALMVVNTMLDYNAICEYTDTEPFKLDQLGVGNLVGIVVAFGVALALSIAAQKAATSRVEGQRMRCITLLAGSGATCLIVAAFRLSYEAASAGRSISGGALASLNAADVFFAGMMLMMLVGEVVASYFDRLSAHEKEAAALSAAIERIESDLENIEEQRAAAAKIVNSRIRETFFAVNAANEIVYESALNRAGELQNTFVGYVNEGKQAREERSKADKERLDELLIPVPDGDENASQASAKSARIQQSSAKRRNAAEAAATAA